MMSIDAGGNKPLTSPWPNPVRCALVPCCRTLQADADSRAAAVARLKQQLDASQQEAAGRAAAAAAAESTNAGLTRQLAELREQLKSAVQQVCV